ncbi:MAG: hypothetical protein ACYTG2_13405 [Planctomycetota bacterium]|jgi:hypothetical protein
MSIPSTRPLLRRSGPALALLVLVGSAHAPADLANLALSDVMTDAGDVGPGDYTATHASDDVTEVLTEMQTSGKPARRLSLLDHIWAFDVAPANNYVFELEAHRSPNDEGDDFRFSYSLDDQTWLPLLTVSKDEDDGSVQSSEFPMDVAGPIYVRVEDTDRTPGHRTQDVLFVDHMAIVSDLTNPDITPPPPCNDVSADSGDALVSLAWDAAESTDVSGYVVERAADGGPFVTLTSQPVVGTALTDATVSNMTLYHYRIRTADAAGNESIPSPEVMAVPHAGGGPVFLHVSSIKIGTQSVSSGWKAGTARVQVLDELGGPVQGALVTVTFGSDYHETLSAATDTDGVAFVRTNQAEKGKLSISGCVVEVTHPTMYYLGQQNAQTCDG